MSPKTARGRLDVPAFIKALRQKHNLLINGGYGKVKGKTFRISNMGNETEESMQELIDALDDVIVRRTRGEHDDGLLAILGADALADLESVHRRAHE